MIDDHGCTINVGFYEQDLVVTLLVSLFHVILSAFMDIMVIVTTMVICLYCFMVFI